MAPRRLAPLLAALALGLPPTPTAQEPGDDAVVKFTVCSTEACGDPAKFEIVANRSSAEGRELIRLGTEQLAAMGKYDWVPHTPIICERPREGAGRFGNREHDWHCRLDGWAFFKNVRPRPFCQPPPAPAATPAGRTRPA
eukprot:COSAG04_NODE_672_length_11281_cov_16.794402_13_plen_140_part_00